jgi:uncharacterized membrane protein HdeD (DUF308 family)
MMKWWFKLKNNKIKSLALAIISLISGIHFLVDPKTVSELVIRGVGFVWIIEASSYGLELIISKQKKLKEITKKKNTL